MKMKGDQEEPDVSNGKWEVGAKQQEKGQKRCRKWSLQGPRKWNEQLRNKLGETMD